MVSTLIFDLDGTLLNTLDDLHDSVCYALQQVGMPLLDKKDTRRFLGNGIANLVAKSVTHVAPMADDALKARTLEIFRAYYVKHSMDKTLPYEGVLPMLAECKRHGLFTAIVSNKLDPAVKDLHKMFFADYIDIAIGEELVGKGHEFLLRNFRDTVDTSHLLFPIHLIDKGIHKHVGTSFIAF